MGAFIAQKRSSEDIVEVGEGGTQNEHEQETSHQSPYSRMRGVPRNFCCTGKTSRPQTDKKMTNLPARDLANVHLAPRRIRNNGGEASWCSGVR